MTVSLYFMSLFKGSEETELSSDLPKHKTLKSETVDPSPRTKERMRKVKSEEDFMKVQVPWIL